MENQLVEIRRAIPADADSVRRVLLESYPSLMASAYEDNLLQRALPLITKPNETLLASGTYYVAEIDRRVVGCGGWSKQEPGGSAVTAGLAHIRHFAVSADCTGRGVGRKLFERCMSDAQDQGILKFQCFASRNAAQFYLRMGFECVGEIDVQMSGELRFPSLLMERPL